MRTRSEKDVVKTQLRFFEAKKAGCLFAAAAARDPLKYGWSHQCLLPRASDIDAAVRAGMDSREMTTLSLLFPTISAVTELLDLIRVLSHSEMIFLDQREECLGTLCLGFRARIGELLSYVTGFANFAFMPKTRRAPCVELTMRVKPRPNYEFVFKEAPPGIVHLADLDMLGMPREKLGKLWDNSFVRTNKILGAKPDLRSAARTSFSIPQELLIQPHDSKSSS
jgi:hypothetical protein